MSAKFVSSELLPAPDRRIRVGVDQAAPYLAFGDDSQYKGVLTFSYVVVPKDAVAKVMKELEGIKRKFRFSSSTAIHCRVLFNPYQRDKAGLGHLANEAAMQIVHHCITLMNKHRLYVRYAYAEEENWTQIWEGKSVIELHNDKGDLVEHPATPDPKGVLGMLAQACWVPTANSGPKSTECEIYAAKDSTMTSFLGDKRRQAHNWIKGISTIDAPPGHWNEIAPSFEPGIYESLFELADVVAFSICHAIHGKVKEPKFVDAVTRIRWMSGAEFHVDLDRPVPTKPKNPFA